MLEQLQFSKEILEGALEGQLGTSLEALLNPNIEELQRLLGLNEAEGHPSFELVCDPSIVNNVFIASNIGIHTSRNHPNWNRHAHDYARLLSQRYHTQGNADDLNLSVVVADQAIQSMPSAAAILDPEHASDEHLASDLDAAEMLNTLATILEQLFLLTGDLPALDRAIAIFEKLASATFSKDDGSRRAGWLSNYASSLQRRFEQSDGGSFDDLNLAIEVSQEAVQLVKDHDPIRGKVLSGAGQPLALLAEINNDVGLMDMALDFFQRAKKATSEAHDLIEIGVNTALRSFQKYKILHSEQAENPAKCLDESIETAIETAKSVMQLAQDHHLSAEGNPVMGGHIHNLLGLFYYHRFFDDGMVSTEMATEALSHLRVAFGSTTYTPVYRRVQAGRLILRLCCYTGDWEDAYNAAIDAVDLIPKISSHSLKTSDKQRLLGAEDVVGFGADAAAAALNAGKTAYEALRILERGRGSLAASVLDLHVDLTALKSKHPRLAEMFITLRSQLQMDSPQRHEANIRFDRLVKSIRDESGFERFLQPPDDQDLREAAESGPLVVLSASQYRGVDAFLVTQGGGVEVLRLQGVGVKDLESRSRDLECLRGLEWLWDSVAKPVLDSLGYTQSPPPSESLPRVWWIPAGVLTRFPFHAAGRHAAGSGDTVMDRVMSSYSSSIKALLATRRRTYSPPRPRQVLMVAMPDTPGRSHLAMSGEEMRIVEGLFASSNSFNTISLRDRPHGELVLQHLRTSQIFHFAGHGQENATNPSQSLLLLHDWEDNPMTVESLLSSSFENLFLAYLSACETGQVTDAKFRDEGIHLAGAHQLAGFCHVIGTLWSVEDSVCVEVAGAVYRVLLEGFKEDSTMTDEVICRALHTAVMKQRDRAVNREIMAYVANSKDDGFDPRKGSKLYDLSENQGGGTANSGAGESTSQVRFGVDLSQTQHWVPYVHYGV